MNQFFIFIKKENTESLRNYRWLWMPLLFILLGIMQPVTTYYLPKIIDSLGDLPEGTVIEIPLPHAPEVLFSTLTQQFNMIGLLVIVLAFMSSVTAERKNGSAALILVKPVSFSSYMIAKWVMALLIVWFSYFMGMMANWYYTYQLFELVNLSLMLKGMFLFGLWLTFIVTLIFFFGSMSNTSGVTAALTLVVTIVLSFLSSVLSEKLDWLPSNILKYTGELWTNGYLSKGTIPTVIITICLIIILIVSSLSIFKRKELI